MLNQSTLASAALVLVLANPACAALTAPVPAAEDTVAARMQPIAPMTGYRPGLPSVMQAGFTAGQPLPPRPDPTAFAHDAPSDFALIVEPSRDFWASFDRDAARLENQFRARLQSSRE